MQAPAGHCPKQGNRCYQLREEARRVPQPEEYFNEDDLEDYKESPDSFEYEICEEKNRVFSKWLDDYVNGLSDDEARRFFYDHMDANLDMDGVQYTVGIPQAIINKAKQP